MNTILSALFFIIIAHSSFAETISIEVAQIVEHPALDTVRKKAIETLLKLHPQVVFSVHNSSAQGNLVTAAHIARQILAKNPAPRVILALGTPMAQAIAAQNKKIPLVFSAITDPQSAKLVGPTITGVTDHLPIIEQLKLLQKITPKAQKVAFLYNSGEANSLTLKTEFLAATTQLGLTPVWGAVSNSGQVLSTAKMIIPKSDAVFISTDNTVASAIDGVVMVAQQLKIPLYVADGNFIAKGALASLSVNYAQIGEQTGEILAQIISGKLPKDIPIQAPKSRDVLVNDAVAKKLGLKIPAL